MFQLGNMELLLRVPINFLQSKIFYINNHPEYPFFLSTLTHEKGPRSRPPVNHNFLEYNFP
jgi:hypothetical protein